MLCYDFENFSEVISHRAKSDFFLSDSKLFGEANEATNAVHWVTVTQEGNRPNILNDFEVDRREKFCS